MVFHWSLNNSKFPQAFRTVLGILADLNNAIIWIVSISPPFSNSSSFFCKPLGIVPRAPITISIPITLMLHNFLSSLAKSKYLPLLSISLFFTLWSAGIAKSTVQQVLFLLLLLLSLVLAFWLGLGNTCVRQNPRKSYAPDSLGCILVCAYIIWLYCGTDKYVSSANIY